VIAELREKLQSAGVQLVRVLWCDNANVLRAKAIHAQALPEYVEHGVGISAAQQAIPAVFDAVAPDSGLSPVGEVRLVPDWATLTPLPYAPGHARVLGDMRLGGQPWPLCPRQFLRRMADEAARAGLEVMAAFENEFYLLRRTPDGFTPADDTVFAADLAIDRSRAVIDEILAALTTQGIPPELYYPESGPGQHEISVRYTHALAAADRQLAFRQTVHAVAGRHGLAASFLPKLFADKAGSGCHLHISLWRGGQNVLPDAHAPGGLSQTARSFVAGLLHHLPALMSVTTPSPNSYRRIRPHFWSGAFRCWGFDNREAAVRVPTHPAHPGPTHLELKTADASANPYLALGSALAAGLDGVRRRLDPGAAVAVDPGYLPEPERRARGIDPLPASLGEAIAHLDRSEVLRGAMGADLARAFLAVRRAEWEALKGGDLSREVALLLERY
jgi:glutamine synthetase